MLAALVGIGEASAAAAAPAAGGGAPAPSMLVEGRAAAVSELPAHAAAAVGRSGRFNEAMLSGPRLQIDLPDGRTLQAVRRSETRGNRGEKVWIGAVEGSPGSLVSLTLHAGRASGFVQSGVETWELQPTATPGLSRLFRVDTERLPREPVLPVAPRDPVAESTVTSSGAAPAPATAAAPVVQDLLIAYTPAAAAANGGASGIESMAINAVNAANASYAASAVNIRLNLVGLRQLSYAETGDMSLTLGRLRTVGDGHLDEVHALRNSLGADLVSLISTDSSACGVGYVLGSVGGNAAYGFNVVAASCLSYNTLAHEIGHNQGNFHDRPDSTGTPLYPFAFGFRSCDYPGVASGQSFRTVMAYPCSGVPRVAAFSNPRILYNGQAPMGIDYESDPANAADNARSMNLTAAAIAAYRSAPAAAFAPTAPSGLKAVLSSPTVATLTWTDNAGNEQGYVVQRADAGGAFVDRATLAANATSFGDTGLTPSTTYSWRVRAFNAAGASGDGSSVTLATPAAPAAAPPAAPTLSGYLHSASTAVVSWSNVAGETGYGLQRSVNGGPFVDRGSFAADRTSTTDLVGGAGQRYVWRVRAFNAAGSSAYSNEVALSTAPTTSPPPPPPPPPAAVPAAPSGLTGSLSTPTAATLSWVDNAADEQGYVLQRSDAGGAFVDRATLAANAASHADTGLAPSTAYVWRLRSYNSVGASGYSNTTTLTTPASPPPPPPPPPPSGTPPTPTLSGYLWSQSTAVINWTNVAGETGYVLQRADNGGAFRDRTSPRADSTGTTDLVGPAQRFVWRIRAVNAAGASAYSNEIVLTTR